MKPKILIVDDESKIRKVISLLLKDEGFEIKQAENGKEAIEIFPAFQPDVILLDRQMPVMDGLETFGRIKELNPEQIVIFITAFGSISLAVELVKKGAYDFIEKPFDNDKLILTIRRAIELSRMKSEIEILKTQLDKNKFTVVGETSGLRQTMAQVKKVANTNTTVLIHGESGTGKELIANSIHAYSSRNKSPFVAINCGAIPLSLIENEFFGHEKGAFTDAKETQLGAFERANSGILFLDEIGELPMDAQVKLLRVLEEKKVTRIGGKRPIPLDVRIVAATNRNLEEEVKKGNFRLDLLYRLNIFTIAIPPLRERKTDIPLLIDFFIRKHNEILNTSVKSITQEAMDMIIAYDWPGNVRDLENSIQSAMILSNDGIIQAGHLPLRVKGYEQTKSLSMPESGMSDIRVLNTQVEKEVILEALRKNHFNRTLTAQSLHISRKTLFNKMKRYGIDY